LKRALRILGEPGDQSAAPPLHVSVGGRVFSIADAHDGTAAARFVSHLRAEGAVDAGEGSAADVQIVVRSTPQSPEARLRADVMEEGADLVLGSARASFARHLASCAVSQDER